jgi:ATP-dependent RNA helicase DDX46/PRP5
MTAVYFSFVLQALIAHFTVAFLQKVKEGKARQYEGSGFGGKGLEKLDQDRHAKDIAQRTAYGEVVEEKKATGEDEDEEGDAEGANPLFDFKVEIRRGPAPDAAKASGSPAPSPIASEKAKEDERRAASSLRAAEEAAAKAGQDTAAYQKAQAVVAKLNAAVRATRLAVQAQNAAAAAAASGGEDAKLKNKDPDATDFHAIIPINDYPQKARWRVTNKETMSQLIEQTGASVTNKGTHLIPMVAGDTI